MKQIVFNSFPRSGNVFSGHTSRIFFEGMFAAVHIPEIFQVKEIANVTVFRKPSDAISSLLNKQLESSNSPINLDIIENQVIGPSELYRTYMSYAIEYRDNIYIGRFEDLILYTVRHFENVAKRFDIPLTPGYEDKFKQMSFTGPTWEDRYDGHVPRPKDDTRLAIEQAVASLPIIQELDREYEIFIEKYQTKVN